MAYDIQFYLEYIIKKEKLIKQEDFNNKLKNVMLSSRDSKNRPKEYKNRKKNSKYEGNAGSLRVLGRVVTMLLSSELENSEVGPLIIKLQEVSELITAPKLTIFEIQVSIKTQFEHLRFVLTPSCSKITFDRTETKPYKKVRSG